MNHQKPLLRSQRAAWLLVFVGLIIVAYYFRAYELGIQSYWIDESFSVAVANAYQQHGIPMLESGKVLWARSPLYHWLLSFFMGPVPNENLTRILSLVSGTALVAVTGLIAYRWFGAFTGLLSGSMLASHELFIAWSRQTREYMLATLIFWLLAYFIINYFRQGKAHRAWIAVSFYALIAVVSVTVHWFLGLLYALIILCVVMYANYPGTDRKMKMASSYYLSVIIALSLIIIVVALQLSSGQQSHAAHYFDFILTNYWAYIPAVLIAFAGSGARGEKQILVLLISLFIMQYLILSFGVSQFHYRYLILVTPAIFIVASYGISRLWLSELTFNRILSVLFLIGILLGGGIVFKARTHYYLESDRPNSPFIFRSYTPHPDFKLAYSELEELGVKELMTPYPYISRIYRGKDDVAVLFTSVINSKVSDKNETYTNIKVVRNTEQLRHITNNSGTLHLLIDRMAKNKMPAELASYIEKHGEMVKHWNTSHWSQLWLYKITGS